MRSMEGSAKRATNVGYADSSWDGFLGGMGKEWGGIRVNLEVGVT